ncbi:MAG: DUF1566 domain-containing protein [Nitrospirae bacterium]|nr:DUF1566 domain-containing protein [Nitrospirota bacterium]
MKKILSILSALVGLSLFWIGSGAAQPVEITITGNPIPMAYPDGSYTEIGGDLKISGQGAAIIFSDNSVQSTATLQGIQGPQGIQGIQGPPGNNGTVIYSGGTAPVNTTGVDGDFYIDTYNKRFYGPKAGGAWGLYFAAFIGKSVLNGAGTPVATGATGNVGDFYIDTTTYLIYGPKVSSTWTGLVGVSLVGPAGPAGAGSSQPRAPVLNTGQKTTYALGDDADWNRGASSGTRFTDNADGTFTDNVTGLKWLINQNCSGSITWAQALTWANTLAGGSCGLLAGSYPAGSWRLPNLLELRSLLDYNASAPAVQYELQWSILGSFDSYVYWTSTTSAAAAADGWYVDLNYGGTGRMAKTFTNYVWPVSGQGYR